MTEYMIFTLLIFMLLAAVIALEAKDLLSSIISVGAVGFMLSVIFLFLKAPDIAIVQVVIEILTLIILIRVTISRDIHPIEDIRDFMPFARNMIILIVLAALTAGAVRLLPHFGTNASRVAGRYLSKGLSETGAANIVSAVILDYRAYDTLGEATVLFTALLGAVIILRRKAKTGGTEQ